MTAHTHPARPAPATTEGGAPKVAAEGACSACCPGPRPNGLRYPVGWLHVRAPGGRTVPSARSVCACGRDRHAIGTEQVTALVLDHADHRESCPDRLPAEGRTAA
ncbi:hypothetical protein D7M15_17855 [Streptomyces sp. Z26]|nr:hypothetical protein D7M15_17855 [Streptomyces sp. Z26]